MRCFSTSSKQNAKPESGGEVKSPAARLTHVDESGRAAMVDVARKEPTRRTATASGRIVVPKVAFELIAPGESDEAERHCGSSDPASDRGARDAVQLQKAKAKARAKGDVLTVAQLAAIMGCKRTPELIPLCHPLPLSHIAVTLHPEARRLPGALGGGAREGERGTGDRPGPEAREGFAEATRSDARDEGLAGAHEYSIVCRATVSCEGKTGVEMEALTAVSVGLLTVWDMLKAVAGREMVIRDVLVERKAGGKSGDFVRVT